MKIATHSGSFHADDLFAVIVLQGVLQDVEVVRTRDADVIRGCDYAVDVGGEYEPGLGRFDHHQKGFSEKRPNGIPFAAAGLVWKHYGTLFVHDQHPSLSLGQVKDVVRRLDEELVQFLDAIDTGYRSPSEIPASLPMIVDAFNPTWDQLLGVDKAQADALLDLCFEKARKAVEPLIRQMILQLEATVRGLDLVRQGEQLDEGRIVVLDQAGLPWYDVICFERPAAQFVVYPSAGDLEFMVRVVPTHPSSYEARQDLPSAWAGLRDMALAAETGVTDAIFCHPGRFIASARSKEGALALARRALAKQG